MGSNCVEHSVTTLMPSAGRVLLTGASRGIGRSVLRELVQRGAHVVAAGRDKESLVMEAEQAPDRVTVAVADLRKAKTRRDLVSHSVGVLGGLDALINCAGTVRYESVGEITEETARLQLEVNLLAPLFLAQAAAPYLKASRGAIVNVASTLGIRASRQTAVYAATKAALISLTKTLALELAPSVRVNAVAPGVVDTAMVRTPRKRDADIAEQLEGLRRLHPLQRLGAPEEVAEAILQLLDASWTTGSVYLIDGGLSIY